MKTKVIKILSIITMAAITIMFASCGNTSQNNNPQEESKDPNTLAETQKLSVYLGDYFASEFGTTVLSEFQALYPDVELEVVRPQYEELQNAVQTLRTELAAGKGPDIIISSGEEFFDVHKTMRSGALLDLAPYLSGDTNLNRTDYIEPVLNAGIYDGKQYIMPLAYTIQPIITSEQALSSAGIDKSQLSTFEGLTKAIGRNLKENPAQKIFFKQRLSFWAYYPWCGIDLLDYKNEKVLVDSAQFKLLMEAYKVLYPQDWANAEENPTNTFGDSIISLKERKHLLTINRNASVIPFCNEYRGLSNEVVPVMLPFPTIDGKVNASPGLYAAISNNSNNKKNAYAFMKIMLNENAQKKIENYYPVLKSAIQAQVAALETDEVTINGIKLNKLAEAETRAIVPILSQVDYCSFGPNYKIDELIFENMEPFFKDEADYDICLKKLIEELTIYISE